MLVILAGAVGAGEARRRAPRPAGAGAKALASIRPSSSSGAPPELLGERRRVAEDRGEMVR